MTRFMVFTYDRYYPAGGANDLLVTAETLDEAKAVCPASECAHIFDTEAGHIVATLSHRAFAPRDVEFPATYAVWKDEA